MHVVAHDHSSVLSWGSTSMGVAPIRFSMRAERRHSPRIEILDELQGHVIALDEPVEIRELGVGGFTMVTRCPFLIGSIHSFRLVRGPGSVVIRGRIIHRRGLFERDTTIYLSGVQFIDCSPETLAWLQAFMETQTAGVRRRR